jgi:hypothetical protein
MSSLPRCSLKALRSGFAAFNGLSPNLSHSAESVSTLKVRPIPAGIVQNHILEIVCVQNARIWPSHPRRPAEFCPQREARKKHFASFRMNHGTGDFCCRFHLWAWLPRSVDDRLAVQAAAVRSVDSGALSTFALRPLARGALVLGYSGYEIGDIRRAVKQLAAALSPLVEKRGHRSRR